MKKTAILTLFALVILVAVAPNLRADEATYKAKCAMCHGADGAGKGKSPSLKSDAVKKMTDEQLTKVIADGNGKASHAYKAKGLTDAQIKSLVTYIRAMK